MIIVSTDSAASVTPLSFLIGVLFLAACSAPTGQSSLQPSATPPVTQLPTITTGSLPQHLGLVWWDFDGGNPTQLDAIEVPIVVNSDPGERSGLFIAALYGQINGVGFYFGLQTNVYDPSRGYVGKGAIFSRWDSQSQDDIRAVAGGFSEVGDYEGQFISVRRQLDWLPGAYRFLLTEVQTDDQGVWYRLDLASNSGVWQIGSLRFPPRVGQDAPPHESFASFLEIYSGDTNSEALPNWSVAVGSPELTPLMRLTAATTSYENPTSVNLRILNSDVTFDQESRTATFKLGPNVRRVDSPSQQTFN